MFLTGAAFVRFANAFLDTFKLGRNFVLVINFLWGNGIASRYTLFQRPEDRAVYWRERCFELTTPIGRVDFARQLYNHLHVLESSLEEDEDTEKKTRELRTTIKTQARKYSIESVTRELRTTIKSQARKSSIESVHTRGTKRKHEPDNGSSNVASRRRRLGDGANPAAAAAELRAHGYEIKPEVIFDTSGVALEPLFKMPSHILTVYRPSDPSTEFIAKELDEGSNELQILADIRRLSTKSEHVISLLDSFPGQAGAWAILPKIPNFLADYLAIVPHELRGNVVEICLGLIEGLTYLHENLFAHGDIKPDNLLVDIDFCLKIIDFDLAVRLRYEGEKVTGYCGTEGWIPPEVEKGLEYDPIKVDCWQCGCVILHLFDRLKESDESLRVFAKELKANDPRDRPQLREWGNGAHRLRHSHRPRQPRQQPRQPL
ncbi:kinase-like protein [Laetiporus sulphureus 93-53]|uniref:Kinase-like protein n=1 Tax=Laetiporus sulphureus 93-53 TaxID=1314785 RepID=A0A165EUZ8_9APHY|nr:kinase-like protein [Laetiporus sulphureus 93-53]KZT07816.1 kinase-like protein [Laetiporus sulphureus 93-53]